MALILQPEVELIIDTVGLISLREPVSKLVTDLVLCQCHRKHPQGLYMFES
jgi:hypothetical protein